MRSEQNEMPEKTRNLSPYYNLLYEKNYSFFVFMISKKFQYCSFLKQFDIGKYTPTGITVLYLWIWCYNTLC